MQNLTVIGIDTAKNYIQLHGADTHGKPVLKKRLTREKFLPFMANLPKCLIGMEACGGAHHWAARLTELGFAVKLMSPNKVKKYVDNHKNDAKDAEACAEAVTRANMQFVPIKNKIQLEIQAQHRARSYYIRQRTGLMNMIRGFLLEIGIAIPKGKAALVDKLCLLSEPENNPLSDQMRAAIQNLYDDLKHIQKMVEYYTNFIETLAAKDERCKRISTVPGIGPITATAIIAKIDNGSEFKKGRELSAYLGLVPKQHSSGEKQRLGGISKHGDRYIRQLLIHGGRAVLKSVMRKDKETDAFEKNDEHSQWARELIGRIGMNKAAVAVANKNARIIIPLLKKEALFQPIQAHCCEAAA